MVFELLLFVKLVYWLVGVVDVVIVQESSHNQIHSSKTHTAGSKKKNYKTLSRPFNFSLESWVLFFVAFFLFRFFVNWNLDHSFHLKKNCLKGHF